MDDKMYYCRYWNHKLLKYNDREYLVCISDKINGNEFGSTVQFHGVIIVDEDVPTIGKLNSNICEDDAQTLLDDLEMKMRNILRNNLKWSDMKPENQVVKVWYYTKNENAELSTFDDKRKYPPLRFAVTVVNIKPINQTLANKIKDELESTLTYWLSNVLAT